MPTAEPVTFDETLAFGPFVVDPARKLVLAQGRPVRLGSRAFDLLIALLSQAGQVIGHDALVRQVWPDTVVEETSLRVHISALRKALGDGRDGARYIANIPGRGYSFVTEVRRVGRPGAACPPVLATPDAQPPRPVRHNLPVRLTRVIGRDDVVDRLAAKLARRRLVSIVGPGGMGKTTVAIAVAERQLASYAQGVRFVDLATLNDPALVPAALAAVLGIAAPGDDPWPALQAFLADGSMLIVLDNCEHVAGAAALLAERILRAGPDLHVLATSREPLDADGEWVHRLSALDMPADDESPPDGVTAGCPAVQLFFERAMANAEGFDPVVADLSQVLGLCRQLDGMPLAIELAAGRIDGLGLDGLVARLDNLFGLLRRGRRTAWPRHRTLQALLDWSHDLLSPDEQVVLRRLSVFRSAFSLDAAVDIAGGDGVDDVVDCLMGLAARSLVAVEPGCDGVQYRLLYTTRAYAADKLAAAGEQAGVARRHAMHFTQYLGDSPARLADMEIGDWVALYGRSIDDVRTGIDWALSPEGDARVGVSLTVAALDLAYTLSAWDEFRPRVLRGLECVRHLQPPAPALELRLWSALCFIGGITVGPDGPQAVAFARMEQLAEGLGSHYHRVEAINSMCVNAFGRGDYRGVVALSARVAMLAHGPSDPVAVLLADRFLALSHHYLGEHGVSRALAERVLQFPFENAHRRYVYTISPQVSMRIIMARIHWIEGRADQARALASRAIEHALADQSPALSQVLALAAIPIALWRGEGAEAGVLIDRLLVHATRHSHSYWLSWARMCAAVLALRAPAPGDEARAAADALTLHWGERDMAITLAPTFVTPACVARAEAGEVGWCAPEVLRARAEQLRANGGDINAEAEAEALLQRALALARDQGALAWELRCTCSLARCWQARGRPGEAHRLLAATCARFTEGLHTADLVEACALLEALRAASGPDTPGGHD